METILVGEAVCGVFGLEKPTNLLQQRIITADLQNWVAKLLGYHFEVNYKAADLLSRIHDDWELNSIVSFPIWVQEQQVQQEIQADKTLQTIINVLQTDLTSRPGYNLRQGVLFYENCFVISGKSAFILQLLEEIQSLPYWGSFQVP